MRPPSCLYSSQRALYRVFIRPTSTSTTQPPSFSAWNLPVSYVQQCRSYAIRRTKRQDPTFLSPTEQVLRDEQRKHDPRFTTAADIERTGRSRLPRDHEITDPQIMVHERDVLEGPLRTQFVMTRIEPHESLRMVTPYVPATKDSPEKLAVCKIVDKKAEFEREKQVKVRKQAKKQNAVKEKELEINWGISANDLQTKIGILTRLMDAPVKIMVSFGKKKRSVAQPAHEDMKNLVQKVKNEIASLGGREYKEAEGFLGQKLKLHFASKKVTN